MADATIRTCTDRPQLHLPGGSPAQRFLARRQVLGAAEPGTLGCGSKKLVGDPQRQIVLAVR